LLRKQVRNLGCEQVGDALAAQGIEMDRVRLTEGTAQEAGGANGIRIVAVWNIPLFKNASGA
jgi:hypothetical protein